MKANSVKKGTAVGMVKPARMSSAPPAVPSKPVVIPTRTRTGRQQRIKGQNLVSRALSEGAETSHDPQSIPPSTAALLALTFIPESRYTSLARSRRKDISRTSSDDDLEISGDSEAYKRASSSSSPHSWRILLSPPHELEQDNLSISSTSTLGPLQYSKHSLSSESMPSLETDAESTHSTNNSPTAAISNCRRSGSERRPKIFLSPSTEDCVLDHPLLAGFGDLGSGSEAGENEGDERAAEIRPAARAKSLFKSNLTASLRIFKSAAASLSNFTAATVQRDDYLARSLLLISPQFTDERRPLPSTDVPDPAVRRYLNPTALSPAELYFHPDQHHPTTHCTASIQLQTCQRALKTTSNNATAPPVFISHPLSRTWPVNEPFPTPTTVRQREPRENSDFLRVIVLEMNMRKVGKLGDGAPGRAKLWLPPRQGSSPAAAVGETDGGPIPSRWVSTSS